MPSLDFKGKQFVYTHHLTVPFRELVVDAKKSMPAGAKANFDDNLIIQGDNLHALKALLPRYAGKVKCIYIDPPYNTGNEGWCYNDNVRSPLMQEWVKHGNPVEREDMERHDKWLSMMWPRLKALRELLSGDGVIFISIGDDECGNLNVLLDEVFGEENHIATYVWKSRAKPTNAGNSKYRPQKVAEYVFAYAKGGADTLLFNVNSISDRKYSHKDENGIYRTTTILTSNRGTFRRETMRFEVGGYTPDEAQRWKAGYDEIRALFETGRIGLNKDGVPFRKHYEQDEDEMLYPLYTYMDEALTGTAESGKSELNVLLGNNHGFDTV